MFITKITFSKAAEFFTIILFSVAENVPITASQHLKDKIHVNPGMELHILCNICHKKKKSLVEIVFCLR